MGIISFDRCKENFEKYEIKNFNSSFSEKTSEVGESKFSKKTISSGIKIPDTFKIKDFEVFGNINYSKFSKNNLIGIMLIRVMNLNNNFSFNIKLTGGI